MDSDMELELMDLESIKSQTTAYSFNDAVCSRLRETMAKTQAAEHLINTYARMLENERRRYESSFEKFDGRNYKKEKLVSYRSCTSVLLVTAQSIALLIPW
ncbi:hypothetical protein TNCV_3594121 [Trichonephila clavipes]|nr:hypothetical protein TNCV_3594121 [Trichonephila clavipes]